MRQLKYPLTQQFDGNRYIPNGFSPGHLFESDSKKALCGFQIEKMDSPQVEFELPKAATAFLGSRFSYPKTCEKCRKIALANFC